jgi:soluble lytic murein transglycosylase-like protein
MRLGLRIAALLLFTALVAPGLVPVAAAAGTYSRIDDEGVTHLTDAPTDPRFRRVPGLSGTANGWLAVPQAGRGTRWGQEIQEISGRYGVDPALVHAVIGAESAFNPWAVSRKGAQGLMQLMPRTASALGVRDSFNPRDNIEGGVRHLGYLLDRYSGNVSLALAAYNAGAGAVDYYGGIPPYPETQQYVQKILQRGGAGAPSVVPSAPVQAIYRSEDSDGTVIFSNVPPVNQVRKIPR